MTGTKIKDFTKTAPPTRAGSEHLTAGEPADKHKLVRRGDLESFAVGLLLIKLDVFGKITRNRVRRFDYPDTFPFVISNGNRFPSISQKAYTDGKNEAR